MKKATFLPVTFYRTASGSDPVTDWFRALSKEDRKRVGLDLLRVQENWPVGMPVCKPLGRGLWEVRTTLQDRTAARVLFFIGNAEICVVHGFVKKSQATPKHELELALRRMKEMKP